MTTPMRRLTPRQRRFIEEYLVDLNGAQAAIRAGYRHSTSKWTAWSSLKKPHIAEALQRAMTERSQRTGITADQVLREYARIAFADIRKFTEKSGDSGARRFKELDALSDDEAAAIVEFSADADGKPVKIKLHDKKKALEALARHLGLFAPRREQSRNPSASAKEIRELIERRFARILRPEGTASRKQCSTRLSYTPSRCGREL